MLSGPPSIRLRDVTLRDGLQSVRAVLPLADKLALYRAITDAGLRELQVTSFVNPAKLPQLADAPELWAALTPGEASAAHPSGQRLNVLVANLRGYERAASAGALDIEAVLAVSGTYSQKNAGRSREQALEEILGMAARAQADGARLSVALATTFHCVYEGFISPDLVLDLAHRLHGTGVRELLLCDTTGHAFPDAVAVLSERARRELPDVTFGAHLHDTRGRGLLNAHAALTAGVRWFDAALGGLGGSPFAPGVGGNLSLELFVELLDGLGVASGVDLTRAVEAARRVEGLT